MGFSERLKAARLKKGFKQRELAQIIKTTNTSVSNWEHGVSQPSASIVELLAQALDVTPFDLLGDFTLQDIQELYNRPSSELSFEEATALTFSSAIMKETKLDLSGPAVMLADLGRDIRELLGTAKHAAMQTLLSNGGEEMLYAFSCLTAEGRVLVMEYLGGVLKVPSFIKEAEPGVDEFITELAESKDKLKERGL